MLKRTPLTLRTPMSGMPSLGARYWLSRYERRREGIRGGGGKGGRDHDRGRRKKGERREVRSISDYIAGCMDSACFLQEQHIKGIENMLPQYWTQQIKIMQVRQYTVAWVHTSQRYYSHINITLVFFVKRILSINSHQSISHLK